MTLKKGKEDRSMQKLSLKQQAYETIRNNIIHCVYMPNSIITEEMIKEQIHASRTPIRDALSRLEQEGLIHILPKKGIRITEITIRELNMIYESRFLIEPYVVLTYGNRIPCEVYMDYYNKYIAFLESPEEFTYSYNEMDANFHKMFINSSENTLFINSYATIEGQITRTRYLTGSTSHNRLLDTTKEHLAIVKAAMKEDWREAADAMKVHLARSKESYFNYLLKHDVND